MDAALNQNNPNHLASSIKQVLDKLAPTSGGKKLPIEMFHGIYDDAVNPKSVYDYLEANKAKISDKLEKIEARFYNGPHSPDLNTLALMGVVMKQILENNNGK